MLALGMAAEAQGVLSLAAGDDPAAASNPDVVGLSAIAALLAGRMDDTGGLASPSLDGRDDVVLWRGVRDAVLGHAAGPTSTLPPLLPLAAGYPVPLRDRVLPVVAETAVLAGHPAAATLPDMPRLGFARALQLERGGQVDAALAAYDALAAGRDQLDQVRGGAGAVELRLATGQVTAAQAADALRRLLPTWRGDGREAATRMRVAELQAQAGAFRPALDLLRETEALFPDARPAIRARMATVFAAVLTAGDATSPLDFVVLAADYADLVPPGPPGAALACWPWTFRPAPVRCWKPASPRHRPGRCGPGWATGWRPCSSMPPRPRRRSARLPHPTRPACRSGCRPSVPCCLPKPAPRRATLRAPPRACPHWPPRPPTTCVPGCWKAHVIGVAP